ncbi:Uncharacterised protein [Shigella sonnei]|nr:Uncharacterised protein [Shigella sonnei]
MFIREQGQFKVINRTGCQGMGLRLNTRNIQLVIKYLNIEYRTKQRFITCRSPAVTDNLFGIVTLMATHFFQLSRQSGCQFRQRFLRRNVNTQR